MQRRTEKQQTRQDGHPHGDSPPSGQAIGGSAVSIQKPASSGKIHTETPIDQRPLPWSAKMHFALRTVLILAPKEGYRGWGGESIATTRQGAATNSRHTSPLPPPLTTPAVLHHTKKIGGLVQRPTFRTDRYNNAVQEFITVMLLLDNYSSAKILLKDKGARHPNSTGTCWLCRIHKHGVGHEGQRGSGVGAIFGHHRWPKTRLRCAGSDNTANT